MNINLLVLHRKESYPGEYAPEIVAVADEVQMDENPDWWHEEIDRQKKTIANDANAWAVVTIDVPTSQIMAALYPDAKADAKIVSTEKLPS